MPKLFVFRGRRKEGSYDLDKKRITIGRGDESDIRLDNPLVSRSHARVAFVDGKWRVEDLATANGLWLNGERVTTADLQIGDTIEIGHHVLVFESPTAYLAGIDTLPGGRQGQALESESTTILPPMEMESIQSKVKLRMRTHVAFEDGGRRREILLEKEAYVLGFSEECDIRLPGASILSKQLATLERAGAGWSIAGITSLAPLRVNGEKVARKQLSDGDEIVVKGVSVTYHAALMS